MLDLLDLLLWLLFAALLVLGYLRLDADLLLTFYDRFRPNIGESAVNRVKLVFHWVN